MPNNPRAGGISRRIEGEERAELKQALAALKLPEEMGVIIRTAGLGRSPEDLQWDLSRLTELWLKIKEATVNRKAPFLAYQEGNVIVRSLRDSLKEDIGEVLVDNEEAFNEATTFVRTFMPNFEARVKMYRDAVPLFNRYQIESQIETAYEREVKLPSGGSIVIDQTEALVSIDINSSKATKGADIEETALNTNLEAADEIARQLRLRDIGGLIVIDFIDMSSVKNQRDVENRVRDATESDRARIQLGRISRFGLMELSRQRLRPSLEETTTIVCPRCSGLGTIRDVKSLALSVLRIIEEEVMKDKTGEIQAQLPVPVATYILNEKRPVLRDIETRYNVRVLVIPNANLETPHFDIQRIRSDKIVERGEVLSFELAQHVGIVESPVVGDDLAVIKRAEPAVKMSQPETRAPAAQQAAAAPTAAAPAATLGVIGQLLAWLKALFGAGPAQPPAPAATARPQGQQQPRQGGRNDGRGNNNRDLRSERGQQPAPRRDQDSRRSGGARPERAERDTNRPERGPRPERDNRGTERSEQARDNRGERGPRTDRAERGEPRPQQPQAQQPRPPQQQPRPQPPQQQRTPESDAAGDIGNKQAPRRDRSNPPPAPSRAAVKSEATGDMFTVAGVGSASNGNEAPAEEQREGGRRRRHRSRRRERQMERQQLQDGNEGNVVSDANQVGADNDEDGDQVPASVFATVPASAGNPATVLDVGTRVVRGQRLQIVTRGDALGELAHLRLGEHGIQFRLADQDDLQEFFLGRFEIGEQPDLLEHLAVQAMRLVHDQHRAPALGVILQQIGIERVDQRLEAGLGRALDAQVVTQRDHELAHREERIEHQRHVHGFRQALEQRADHEGLAGADFAGQQHESAAAGDAVHQVRQGVLVTLAEIQIAGVGRKGERVLFQPKILVIHASPAHPVRVNGAAASLRPGEQREYCETPACTSH